MPHFKELAPVCLYRRQGLYNPCRTIPFALKLVGFENTSIVSRIKIPLVIFGHGFLHNWISSKQCNPPIGMGTSLYSAYVVALVALDILGLVPFLPW